MRACSFDQQTTVKRMTVSRAPTRHKVRCRWFVLSVCCWVVFSFLPLDLTRLPSFLFSFSFCSRVRVRVRRGADFCVFLFGRFLPLTINRNLRCRKQMPSNFRSLTNTSQEENMVQEPNLDTFVVCRAKEDIGLVQIGEVNPLILENYVASLFV